MSDNADTLRYTPAAPDKVKEADQLLKDDDFSELERVAFERIIWRKVDGWVLPLCTIFYLLSFLDRSNISNARVAGMQKSLGMSNHDYSVALTVTYVPYIFAEFPATLLLKRIGPNILLPTIITLWGLITTCQGFVHNYSGLLACRFFLGLMEGGLFPCITLYLSSFYPRDRLQVRVATFFAAASLSGAFSGLLAAGIDHIGGKGGRPGWAWIFILEGIFTFLFGLISFLLLPHSPERARFLSEEERFYLMSRLKEDGAVFLEEKKDGFTWPEALASLKSPHVLLLLVALFFNGAIMFGMAYFEATIVKGLGYKGNRAQLMSVPPFAVAFVCSIISAFLSDRYHCRGRTAIFFSVLEVIGFCMFYASKSSHVRYASLFFSIAGTYCTVPPLMTWMANNSVPHFRRATSVAAAVVMANIGGILATWLLGYLSRPPNYTKAIVTYIIMAIGMAILSAINLVYLSRQNYLKAEMRQKMKREDEPAGLGDRSAWFVYNL